MGNIVGNLAHNTCSLPVYTYLMIPWKDSSSSFMCCHVLLYGETLPAALLKLLFNGHLNLISTIYNVRGWKKKAYNSIDVLLGTFLKERKPYPVFLYYG